MLEARRDYAFRVLENQEYDWSFSPGYYAMYQRIIEEAEKRNLEHDLEHIVQVGKKFFQLDAAIPSLMLGFEYSPSNRVHLKTVEKKWRSIDLKNAGWEIHHFKGPPHQSEIRKIVASKIKENAKKLK